MSDLKIQGVVEMSAEGAERVLERVGDKAVQMAARTESAAQKAGDAVDGIGAGANGSADQLTRAEGRMLASIKRVQTQFELAGKTASQAIEYKIDAKGLDASKFEPALAKLRELEAAALHAGTTSNASLNSMGMSAKATAAALRGVPAQFTDIITSLQGGQDPLTVFLQQGGQLKDMFGGAGNAAKALGGYALGLVNPLTLAAGAAAALGVAYYQGSNEAQAFATSLIMSGNAAGTTSGQLMDMAKTVSSATGATRGAVAETLNEIAASGKVSADVLAQVGKAAIDMERVGGQAASATVKEFVALGEAPVSAILKLNEKYHFLTAAVYEQVKALQDQGRETDAAKLAQTTYADALEGRIPLLVANLGTLESAWKGVLNVAKLAWDNMRSGGRASSLEDQIAAATKRLNGYSSDRGNGNFGTKTVGGTAEDQARVNALSNEIEARDQLLLIQQAANAADAAGIKTVTETAKLREKYLTNDTKLKKELAAIDASSLSTEEKKNAVIMARAQYAEKPKEGTKNDAAQQYAAALAAEKNFAASQIKLIKARVAEGVESEEAGIEEVLAAQISGYTKEYALLTDQIAKTKDVGDKARLGQQLAALGSGMQVAASEYQSTLAKIEQAQTRYMQSQAVLADNSAYKIEQENVALREQIDVLGLTDKQLGEHEAAKVRVAAAANYLDAANLREAASQMEAAGVVSDAIPYYRQLADAREAAGKALDKKSLLESEKGMKKSAIDAANEWKKTSEKICDNITDALMRGFEAGKTFAENLRDATANMFKTLILRPIIQATVTGGLSAVGLGSSGALASDTSSTSSLGSFGSLASGAKSAYDLFSGGAANTYNNMASSSLGQSLGLSTPQAAGYMAPVYDATGALISEGTNTAAGGLTSLGSSIGTSLAYAGAGLIGSAIGSAIAGDKRIISGVSGSMVGAAVGALGGPIGSAIGGVLGGVIDAAFGMGEKEYTDKGIQGTFSGASFSGNSYQNWEQEGGWFSGDDDGTETSPLNSAATSDLSATFAMLKLETGRLAAGLGVDTANIAAYSKAINVTLTDDATANAKAMSDMIAGISEEMSAMVLAGTNFKLAGETSSETLSRLYNSLATVNQAFASINMTAYETSLAGGDMASQLALLMGGIDSFKTSITSYYSTYFSAQEQQADLVKQTTESIKALGVAVPATKEGFRALIEGLDMTTAAGRTTFAGLMSVSAAFATMTDAAAAALKSATELSASVAGDAYAALDRAVSAQKKALETAFTKQKNEWDIAVAAANEIKGTLTSLSSTLHSAVRSVVVESDSLSLSRRAEAQVTLNSAVVTSKSGGSLAPFADAIASAIADLSAPSESLYASFEEYARAQGRANAALTELQNASDSQLSVADRTLKEIQSASDAAEAAYTKQIADLDETLSVAKLQLDATNGINTTILTMSDALKALSASITDLALNRSLSGLPTGTGSSSTAINTAGVTAAYDKYLGTTGDKAGIAWQVAHIADGSNTLAQIVDNIANSADAQKKAVNDAYVKYLGSNADSAGMAWQLAHIADGSNTLAQIVENIKNAGSSNSHASGLERVPYDGYQATLHAGEAVVDASSTRAISRYFGGGGGNNNDAMVAELKALREEVNLLRYEARATATNTGRTAKALDKFDNDGMPAERIAA